MKQQQSKQTEARMRELERAAWFARLAFGDTHGEPQSQIIPQPMPRRFEVMP